VLFSADAYGDCFEESLPIVRSWIICCLLQMNCGWQLIPVIMWPSQVTDRNFATVAC